MTRLLFVLTLFLIAAAGYLFVKYYQDSYEVFPMVKQQQQIQPPMANFDDWREYTPPSGEFKGLFPFLPQHVSDNKLDPKTKSLRKYNSYLAENNDGTIYLINQIAFSDNLIATGAAAELLTGVMNEM